MGDFNLSQQTEGIKLLRQEMSDPFLSDQTIVYGPVGTFTGFNLLSKLERKIDYIFINDQLYSTLYQTIDDRAGNSHPSDHLPVMTKIKWVLE
jgi:endonuclease/exonuclease/phosphatase family metal-dependent hydrolase